MLRAFKGILCVIGLYFLMKDESNFIFKTNFIFCILNRSLVNPSHIFIPDILSAFNVYNLY